MDIRIAAMWFGVLNQMVAGIINIYYSPWCFVLWTIADLIFIQNALKNKEYHYVGLFSFYVGMNVFGFSKWIGVI